MARRRRRARSTVASPPRGRTERAGDIGGEDATDARRVDRVDAGLRFWTPALFTSARSGTRSSIV
jgi:hypothetical protein